MATFPLVRGLKLRATLVNSCGLPIAGPANTMVTDGYVSASLTAVMNDAEELEQKNAEGRVCVSDRTPPERKHYTVELELCNVSTGLISLFSGWEQILDYNGDSVGFQDATQVSEYGVVIEIWTGGRSDDDCPAPTDDSIFSTAASRSSCRLAMLSASASVCVVTQFTHCPPCSTPTEKVQASVVISSMAMICLHISRMALRPSPSRAPAWLGRPVVRRLNRAMA
jgi:hypothetical protein